MPMSIRAAEREVADSRVGGELDATGEAEVDVDGVVPILHLGPEAVIGLRRHVRAARMTADDKAPIASIGDPPPLGHHVVDTGLGRDRKPDEPVRRDRRELVDPVVVGADARHLELRIGTEELRLRSQARIQDLSLDHVELHLGQSSLRIVRTRTDLIPSSPVGGVGGLVESGARARHPMEALSPLEGPADPPVVGSDHSRR